MVDYPQTQKVDSPEVSESSTNPIRQLSNSLRAAADTASSQVTADGEKTTSPIASAIAGVRESVTEEVTEAVEKIAEEAADLGITNQAYFRVKIGGVSSADKKKDEAKDEEKKDEPPANSDNPLGNGEAKPETEDPKPNAIASAGAAAVASAADLANKLEEERKAEEEKKKAESGDEEKKPQKTDPPSDVEEAQDAPREMIFDSRFGQIIGFPYVSLSTYMHNQARIVLYDPDDKIRPLLKRHKNVEIEVGFVNGYKKNKFIGVLYSVGRRIPDGTIIEAVDPAYELQRPGAGVSSSRTPVAKSEEEKEKAEIVKETSAEFDRQMKENPVELPEDAGLGDVVGATGGVMGVALGNVLTQREEAKKQEEAKKKAEEEAKKQESTTTTEQEVQTEQVQGNRRNRRITMAESVVREQQANGQTNLKYSQEGESRVDREGEARLQMSEMGAIVRQAALEGKTIAVRGNTIAETDPGKAPASGAVIDYKNYPDIFIGHPEIINRTGVHLKSGYGAMMVAGTDVAGKQTIGAVAVTSSPALQHPTGQINPPEWGAIKLSDPIIPGSPYTWADATKNGARVPATKEIMGGIIKVCTVITQITEKNGGKKYHINSWYRDPASNRRANGASQSRHLSGDAIDFSGHDALEVYKQYAPTWEGGLARMIRGGSLVFTHIDTRGSRSRWDY